MSKVLEHDMLKELRDSVAYLTQANQTLVSRLRPRTVHYGQRLIGPTHTSASYVPEYTSRGRIIGISLETDTHHYCSFRGQPLPGSPDLVINRAGYHPLHLEVEDLNKLRFHCPLGLAMSILLEEYVE